MTLDNLPAGHPIQTLMLEHQEILKYLTALEQLEQKIGKFENSDSLETGDLEKLKYLAAHLTAAEKHHLREEKVLFPEVEARGVYGPPQVMALEHIGLRKTKKALEALANQDPKSNFSGFQEKLCQLTKEIVSNLRGHIYKEDNILYPAALEAIPEAETWEKLKKSADKIGYCCFTPNGKRGTLPK